MLLFCLFGFVAIFIELMGRSYFIFTKGPLHHMQNYFKVVHGWNANHKQMINKQYQNLNSEVSHALFKWHLLLPNFLHIILGQVGQSQTFKTNPSCEGLLVKRKSERDKNMESWGRM